MFKRRYLMVPVLLLMTLLFCWSSATATSAAREINIHVGETYTLRLHQKFSELAVGNPQVADYFVRENTPNGAEVLINGKQVGATNLLVWNLAGKQSAEYTIKVLVRDLKAYLRQLQELVGKVEGVRFRIGGDKVVIEGEALVPAELERMNKMIGDAPQVVNAVTVSPVALKVIAKKVEQNIGDPGIQVEAINQKIVLRGVVYTPERKKQLEREVKLYYPQVENFLTVQDAKFRPGKGDMIQVTGQFMEVSNAVIDGWGINWSPGSTSSATGSQSFGDAASGFTGTVVATITNLFPKYSRAKEQGGARVLETSSVSVRSGEKAELQSGGELGVPVIQPSGGTTIDWKKHGVFLNVTPVSRGDEITLRISVEVSAPSGTSPGGFINFKRSQISTVQFCKSGDSIALGGLVSNRDSKVFDKLPEGDGALFQVYASEDFRKQKSQFVIFITPQILKGGAKEAHQELRGTVGETFEVYKERKR